MLAQTSRTVSSDGATKSRSVENRPAPPSRHFRREVPPLEDQQAIVEVPELGQEPEQVILGDIQKRGTVGVGPTSSMQANECPRQALGRHRLTPFRAAPARGR